MDYLVKLQELATSRGGSCLATTWSGSKNSYPFRCSKGHEWVAQANNVMNGTWCHRCHVEQRTKTREHRQAVDNTSARLRYASLSHRARAASRMKSRYGLSFEEYEVMLSIQDNKCAICDKPPKDGKRLFIDHNHLTGDVRGLLCVECNTGLGMFGDRLEVLQKAIEYLHG